MVPLFRQFSIGAFSYYHYHNIDYRTQCEVKKSETSQSMYQPNSADLQAPFPNLLMFNPYLEMILNFGIAHSAINTLRSF